MPRKSARGFRRYQKLAAALALIALPAVLGGCGGAGGAGSSATLMLDFTPNAVHAGIYTALHEGFDRAAGVKLQVQQPAESTDSIKLLLSGRVDFAILDIHDLALADQAQAKLVGVLPIVQEPLAALIAEPSIENPRQLEGKVVGITGAPSDEAVLDSVLSGAGGDPNRVKRVNIGFQAVPSLLANRVAATTSFWNDEGVELQSARAGMHEFRVNDFGAPAYPELVLCTTRGELARRARLVADVVKSIVHGYRTALADPQRGIDDLLSEVPGLDRKQVTAQFAALRHAFLGNHRGYGELDIAKLLAWSRWEARFGIVRRPPDVWSIFDASPAAR